MLRCDASMIETDEDEGLVTVNLQFSTKNKQDLYDAIRQLEEAAETLKKCELKELLSRKGR